MFCIVESSVYLKTRHEKVQGITQMFFLEAVSPFVQLPFMISESGVVGTVYRFCTAAAIEDFFDEPPHQHTGKNNGVKDKNQEKVNQSGKK